jgi:hypothetical protein
MLLLSLILNSPKAHHRDVNSLVKKQGRFRPGRITEEEEKKKKKREVCRSIEAQGAESRE